MENWSRFKHDTVNNVFGKSKTPTIVGTLVTLVYTVLIMLAPFEIPIQFVAYLGPLFGGAVAGALLNTNVYQAVMYGFRAGAYGFVLFGVLIGIGSFVLLSEMTGQQYFLLSSLASLIVMIAIVPGMGLLGGIAGPIGIVARRTVFPSRDTTQTQ